MCCVSGLFQLAQVGLHVVMVSWHYINPYNTELFNLNFHSLEVVSRYRDPQVQVTENLRYLWNLIPNKYQCIKIESTFYF